MKPMRLFTAFHANLDFSALPDADRPVVIARCYWPLLDLPERHGIPLGFELSARTLRALAAEDPEWVKRFRGLAERELIEPIASGWAQIVAPLAPTEINRANLALGNALYRELLGFVPETFFVAEQTWSDSLVELYQEAGAKRIVMEWNNPAARRRELRALRCQPARLRRSQGDGPALLWNDSIVFQKVQRVAHGQIPLSELDQLIDRLALGEAAEALCVYGGDVEIFDYRPSHSLPAAADEQREIDRLIATLRHYAEDPRFEFCLPRDVADETELLPEVELGSAAEPIPCKKQPRYNPTRWAVSGRDGFGMNTRCHALLRGERAARGVAGASGEDTPTRDLVELWRSDFRTRATEEKIAEFDTRIGLAGERSQERLEASTPQLAEGEDLLLVNPSSLPWQGMPIEVPLRLPAGRYFDLEVRCRRGETLGRDRYQLEVSGRHRDGSIREAILVVEPELAAHGSLGLALSPIDPSTPAAEGDCEVTRLETDRVRAELLGHRGAALAGVVFPALSAVPLVGTIPHGHFDEIAYTPDFYSGHVVAVGENGRKETDLRRTSMRPIPGASGPVRLAFETSIDTAFGPWRKIVRLYRHAARLDVVHDLALHDARLASLRLGTFTLRPAAWDRNTLRYGTLNGGSQVEWRALPVGTSITQSRAVSPSVSAHSCLGATEGWVAFEDARLGIVVSGDRASAAVAPLLDFEDVDDSFFCRLSHTAAETDETRATFMRGRRRFAFALEAYEADDREALERVRRRQTGLIHRTEAGVGLSIGIR